MYGDWKPYVPVAERRKRAAAHAARLRKKGRKLSPVVIAGRAIARSFWGKAWCDNLESYRDYESRLPRGRTYARNGSVIDLQILPGSVTALVYGSELYEVAIAIEPLAPKRWTGLVEECSGGIGSLVELLRGTISEAVLQVLARPRTGLFPEPREVRLACSCPDGARMCKHVAAALYGVGARLDEDPSLFFTLRQVDGADLVSDATTVGALESLGAGSELDMGSLANVFGIEFDEGADLPPPPPASSRKPSTRAAATGPKKRAPRAAVAPAKTRTKRTPRGRS